MDCRGRLVCHPLFFGTPHCVPHVLYGNLDYPSIRMGGTIGRSRRDLLHFRVAKIKELAPSSWRQANVHRTFAFNCSNPSLSAIKKNPSVLMGRITGGAGGICCISALRKLRSWRHPAGAKQMSTGHLHLNVQIPHFPPDKPNPHPLGWGFGLSGGAGGI